MPRVTGESRPPFHATLRLGVAVALLLALAGCGGGGTAAASPSPSELASPSPEVSPSPSAEPSPSASPIPPPSPVPVPSWATMRASCAGAAAQREAILVMQHSTTKILADVTDPAHPRTICTFSGLWQPDLVTAGEISWAASQHAPGTPGPSVIATLDLFTGTPAVVRSWQGGGYLDGVHAWSRGRELLAYLTSDSSGVNLHLLSGGGDRVVASLGAIPGRGVSPTEDDLYLGFSPDGAYFALEQTFTPTGAHLQIRKSTNGTIVYSEPAATMATWGSSGSKLYFRHPGSATIYAWDPEGGRTQPIAQSLPWIKPVADAGDEYLAYTVRDAAGTPHVVLNAHGARAGTQLPSVRSSPVFLNATTLFYIEEAPCGTNCGIGPSTQPTGKTLIYDISRSVEATSTIFSVLAVWPRPGQV